MAPVRRNGVLLKSTGPDSGERRVGKRTHSAPGRDATVPNTYPFIWSDGICTISAFDRYQSNLRESPQLSL